VFKFLDRIEDDDCDRELDEPDEESGEVWLASEGDTFRSEVLLKASLEEGVRSLR